MRDYIELTAPRHRCALSASCPAVFRDGSVYVIIGKTRDDPSLGPRIGQWEEAIEIPCEILDAALAARETA